MPFRLSAGPCGASAIVGLHERHPNLPRAACTAAARRCSPCRPSLPGRCPPSDRLGLSSLAVHAGERLPAFDTKPVTTPIYSTVAFEAPSAAALDEVFEGTRPGYAYTRHGGNPTCEALEQTITRLERGACAIAFSSGMAALHAAVLAAGVGSGDHMVSSQDIYGATQALFRDVLAPLGIETRYAPATDLRAFADAVASARPRAVFVETISNPLFVSSICPPSSLSPDSAGALTIVDSTFTSPRLMGRSNSAPTSSSTARPST